MEILKNISKVLLIIIIWYSGLIIICEFNQYFNVPKIIHGVSCFIWGYQIVRIGKYIWNYDEKNN